MKLRLIAVVAAVLLCTACISPGTPAKKSETLFPLTIEESDHLEGYRKATREIVIDDFTNSEEVLRYTNPYTQAYEGYRVLRLFGLHKTLSLPAQYEFVRALYSALPIHLTVGASLRNIIIPSWFSNGEPLILHITQAFTANQDPVVLALANTAGGIRRHGYPVIKRLEPAVDYPRFINTGDGYAIRGNEQYATVIFPDGRVSASGAIGHLLPPFEDIEGSRAIINISDAYLRDENIENDEDVFEPLRAIANDETEEPILRIHAQLQLFMYYLFQGDVKSAQRIADTVQVFMLEQGGDFTESGTDELVLNDLPAILKIARALDAGDDSLR